MIAISYDMAEMEKLAKQLRGFLKEVIMPRLSNNPDEDVNFENDNFTVDVLNRVRAGGLDRDKILEEMGEDWVEEHSKESTEYKEMRIRRKA